MLHGDWDQETVVAREGVPGMCRPAAARSSAGDGGGAGLNSTTSDGTPSWRTASRSGICAQIMTARASRADGQQGKQSTDRAAWGRARREDAVTKERSGR
jgi:hypothetical protein